MWRRALLLRSTRLVTCNRLELGKSDRDIPAPPQKPSSVDSENVSCQMPS